VPKWYDSVVLADNKDFNAGESVTGSVEQFHTPAVCLSVDALGALSSDTVTVEIEGEASNYEVASQDFSTNGDAVIDVPQGKRVRVTSSDGSTITAEARNNPR
jgi:hypothetical protein